MNGTETGLISDANGNDLSTFLSVVFILLILFVFSFFFNRYIQQLGNKIEGFVWLEVVIGTLVTLGGIGALDEILDWNAFFIGCLAYAASGSPMIWGAVMRFIDEQNRARKAAADDTEETLAE